MAMLLTLAAGVVLGALGVLILALKLDELDRISGRLQEYPLWPGPVNLRHLMIALVVTGLFFLLAASENLGGMLLLGSAIVLGLLIREWVREFLFLMHLRDDDLPGQFDKLIWALLLTTLAPVGLLVFRVYRHQRWPKESTASAPVAEPGAQPRPTSDLA